VVASIDREIDMKALLATVLGVALIGAVPLARAAEIDVMTQNQYIGADLAPVLVAATAQPFDPLAFNAAVVDALTKIAAARPTERARALAAAIAQRNPDVVGLQEAYKFDCAPYPGYPTLPGLGCDDPAIRGAFTDQLLNTVAALRGRYTEVGRVTNLDVPALPFAVNGYPAMLVVADRDAILARSDLRASSVDLAPAGLCAKPSDQGCNFQTAPPVLTTPLGSIAVERGFLAADVVVKGRSYRVFNTHLEQRLLAPNLPETRLLQVGQAYELLGAAQNTAQAGRTAIIVGDMNSEPRDTIPGPVPTPYLLFAGNGFTDAWTLRPQADAGFTCCQAEDLRNASSQLHERIDLIFSSALPTRVLDMRLLGTTLGDKTRPPGNGGLWPADHAAVAAKLQFE
jgi:endonuclease/exonuclease/phosphatase family metal-dependent hydrolase